MHDMTGRAAKFIADTRFDDIPKSAVSLAKDAILDCCGVTLAARDNAIAPILMSYAAERLGPPKSTILGTSLKTSPEDAALINGTLAHALDFDDVHSQCGGHVSVVLVPAILALAEEMGASGRDVSAAYVVGFEIIYRLGRQMAADSLRLGFHTTALWGPVGAAAAAANLLKLGVDQTRMALAIAASSASGLLGNSGSMTKPLHAGNGARAGIVAAKLAQKGLTGATDIFEQERGFISVFSQAPVRQDAMDSLGDAYALADGVEFKLYPSCGKTQSGIESTLYLVHKHDLVPEDIAEIVCEASEMVPRIALKHHNPTDGLQAKFSMEYVASAAILDRAVGLAQFTDEAVTRPAARALMQRFRYVHPDHLQGPDGLLKNETIRLRLRDGRELARQAERVEGRVGSRIDTDSLMIKFRDCVASVLSPTACERSLALLRNLDELKSVTELIESLRASTSTEAN
jgi:2-methylcitrate dehydratase PrpD